MRHNTTLSDGKGSYIFPAARKTIITPEFSIKKNIDNE
jgi:hypothetical protein